ncbi:MAG TPA: enolase C-terminal domain-like protein [Streptosporangiaceae bacterium]|jgi:L-rhamnonate dehydratase|nr:enolase C-terminal domain-like protein [Streptosporangiaceae bacterium]
MTIITGIRARNVGYSRDPETLRANLVSNTAIFEDYRDRPGGWFGESFCTVVEVETGDGVIGVGTAGVFCGAAKHIVEDYLADLVLGLDVRDHERLWQRMYRTTVRFGRRGAAVAAISAVDIACWDAHGLTVGCPVVELLGGSTRTSAPVYASRLYALEDLDALAAEARGYVAAGFTRMKQRFGFGPKDGPAGMARNVELVATVRDAVGPDIEVAADAYMGWDFGYALQMAERLREFGLSWIEEPLMPEQTDRYAELRERIPWQRWTCGEHSYTKWDFAELIAKRATDILQPDLNRAGGITEGRKIAVLAETAGLPVIPHSNEAHNLALVFSQSPHVCPVIEFFPDVEPDTGNELFWKLHEGNPLAEGGEIRPPAGPGLGVSLRADVVTSLLTEDGTWHRQ